MRFHLTHPAEKQAWEKLLFLQSERRQSFSQIVSGAVNAYGTEPPRFSREERAEIVYEVTESVAIKLQQMLPAFLAGYSAGANAPATVNAALDGNAASVVSPQRLTVAPNTLESDDALPDFGDSCMDFDFIGG